MATGDPSYLQVANNGPAAPAAGGQEGGQEGEGQAPAPSVFETLKSVAMRAMIFYFIMSFFKKPQQQTSPGADGTTTTARGAATNLYTDGMGFDLYVYLSEQDDFNDFNVSIKICHKRQIKALYNFGLDA